MCTLCEPCPFPLCSSRFGWRIGRLQLISRYMLSFYPICLYRFSVTEKEMNAVSAQWRVYPSLLWALYYSHSHVSCVFWCKAFLLSKQGSAGMYLFLTSIFNCGQSVNNILTDYLLLIYNGKMKSLIWQTSFWSQEKCYCAITMTCTR